MVEAEDWEKQPEEKGMRRWCIVSEERKDKFETAAKEAEVDLISTSEGGGKSQIWTFPNQDMEQFWEEFNRL